MCINISKEEDKYTTKCVIDLGGDSLVFETSYSSAKVSVGLCSVRGTTMPVVMVRRMP